MLIEAFVCLALNVYFEARNHTEAEMVNVAHVVLNRVADDRFPDNVCAVVKEGGEVRHRCQFSWHCDGKSDVPYEKEAWDLAQRIAAKALASDDTTNGALFYQATWLKPDTWWSSLQLVHTDNAHRFYIPREPAS